MLCIRLLCGSTVPVLCTYHRDAKLSSLQNLKVLVWSSFVLTCPKLETSLVFFNW